MNLKKINEYLIKQKNAPKIYEQDYFYLAICEIILGNYPKAKNLFTESIIAMFGTNSFWRASSQPNWLVDIAILSGRSDLYPSVLEELTLYRLSSTKSKPVGNSPMAHYCYSVMEIACPNSGNISEWIKDLIKRPKYKDLYAAGLALQAILSKDQASFISSLHLILKAHEGQAKHGDLRWSPEGWLCLPAMTLSFLACQKNLKVEIDNEYLSLGYLAYLMEM
jgi:hypothetical protein